MDPLVLPTCPYCQTATLIVGWQEVYDTDRFGERFIVCSNRPHCDARTAYREGVEPGRLADKRLRRLRMDCHAVFDRIWRAGLLTRSQAYRELAERLRMPRNMCHVRMLDERTAVEFLLEATQLEIELLRRQCRG